MIYNSPCIEQIGDNQYRCKNTNIIITTTVLPIRCGICDSKEMPPLLTQAVNLGKAIGKHILNGAKRVSEEEFSRRMDICNDCPYRVEMRCSQCGCRLDIKNFWDSEKCPLLKW